MPVETIPSMNRFHSKYLLGLWITGGVLVGVLLGWLSTSSRYPAAGSAATPTADPFPSAVPTAAAVALPTRLPATPPSAWRPVKVGSTAPDFSLQDSEGNNLSLSELLEKGPVVINFWASWCPPCREEMPDLEWLSKNYADEGLSILGVNTTYVDVRDDALAFIDELGLTFPIVFDESGEVGEELYSVISLPTSYWIDRNGIVQQVQVGAIQRAQMVDLAELLILP